MGLNITDLGAFFDPRVDEGAVRRRGSSRANRNCGASSSFGPQRVSLDSKDGMPKNILTAVRLCRLRGR
ncbi:hypothetical protein BDV37DRAFT_242562 [Aspergillus pseudonomiae]|uniref:Uncharacterized protein n=1 Tax=Aspergillus pseudonomiae TaxID=1506151 RepID=A0A5N7DKH0_9EURO|nr:uncharacterized protein BDV37DRAFT_242562 [Aspergillus pseudonomiae]KAE8406785.1 hypothetical protein BDV37DRAFT_242562 [Aspergillus pseudonomiae]